MQVKIYSAPTFLIQTPTTGGQYLRIVVVRVMLGAQWLYDAASKDAGVEPRRGYEGGDALTDQLTKPTSHHTSMLLTQAGRTNPLPWGRPGRRCHIDILAVHAFAPRLPPPTPWPIFLAIFSCMMSLLCMRERSQGPAGGWAGALYNHERPVTRTIR